MADQRSKKITQTSLVGIGANVLLAGSKALVGLIAGSIAVVLDAVNNLTDALSSIITILGVKLASRKPDKRHPFGYGRVEYFSAILVAAIVLSAGVTSLIESVKKIFVPETPDFSVVTLIVLGLAVFVKLILGRYVKAQGKKLNSDALVASGSDASFDAILSAATLLGAAITLFTGVVLDGYLGVAISVFICKAGVEMLLESASNILGNRADSETTKAIREAVEAQEGVLGAYDLILHNYGPQSAIGSIHIEVPDTMNAKELHTLTRKIQVAVLERFAVFLTVGVYAVDMAHLSDRNAIKELVLQIPGAKGVHGVFFDDAQKTISFDVLTDFTVRDRAAFCREVADKASAVLPDYQITVNLDSDYSD